MQGTTGDNAAMTEEPSYEELTKAIRETSLTYLPALLIEVVGTCRERKVFRNDDAMLTVVNRLCQIEDKNK